MNRTGIHGARRYARPIICIAVALLGFLVHLRALQAGWVWDDGIILREVLPALDSIRTLLSPPTDVEFMDRYYRPLVYASYLADRAVGGGTPAVFHATVVIAHALCAALVAWLAVRLLPPGSDSLVAALGAGALFATHPVHVESVAAVTGRSDIFACLFLLVMACALCRTGWLAIALVGVAYFLALCAKEVAVGGVVLAFVIRPEPRQNDRRLAGRIVALLLALGGYTALRLHALGSWAGGLDVSPHAPGQVLGAALYYLEQLIVPFGCPFVPKVPAIAAASVLASTALMAAMVVVVWCRRADDQLPWVAATWLVIGLVPNLAVAARAVTMTPVAERYAYLPSVAVCWLFGATLGWLCRRGRGGQVSAILAGSGLVAIAAGFTLVRVPVWHDGPAFWRAASACGGDHCFPRCQLADYDVLAGRVDEAEPAYREALNGFCPDRFREYALARLGLLAYQQERLDDAEQLFGEAAAASLDEVFGEYGLALCAVERGNERLRQGEAGEVDFARAASYLRQVLAKRPRFVEAHYLLGEVLGVGGDLAAARHHWQTAITLQPESEAAKQARAALRAAGTE